MKIDKFVIAIIGAVILAWFLPGPALFDGLLNIDNISSIGVSLIFFFYGLKISREKMIEGLKNWKTHTLVLISTFVLFPLIVLSVFPLFDNESNRTIWLGLFFLAALPSTVSSSVVMVSLAKGNVPAAIFNASISGLIGIIITPLWLGLFYHSQAGGYDFGTIYTKLVIEILLPVTLGLVLHRFGHKLATRYSKTLSMFDKTVILLIIYKSFASSFTNGVFEGLSVKSFAITVISVIVLFFIMFMLTGYLSHRFRLNLEDRITVQFCGTKKSLVHGTVFSGVIFGSSAMNGLILIPLMIFHAFQILYISFIATRLSKIMVSDKYH